MPWDLDEEPERPAPASWVGSQVTVLTTSRVFEGVLKSVQVRGGEPVNVVVSVSSMDGRTETLVPWSRVIHIQRKLM
ncbi:MAG: hypothetical protein ACRD0W_19715 [Acidimicrobiales bacterium]